MPLHDLPCRLWWPLRFTVQRPSMLCSRLKTQKLTIMPCVNRQRSGPAPNAPQLLVYFYHDNHRRHRSSILNQTTH